MAPQPRHNDDDDFETIDGHQVLKDGRRMRVPLHMADSAQRAVAQHALRHSPGFLRDAVTTEAKTKAMAEYERALTDAWRSPPTQDASGVRWSSHVGDVCTVRNAEFPDQQGAPGHLQTRRGQLVCVPDQHQDDASFANAREQYRDWLSNAWRGRYE